MSYIIHHFLLHVLLHVASTRAKSVDGGESEALRVMGQLKQRHLQKGREELAKGRRDVNIRLSSGAEVPANAEVDETLTIAKVSILHLRIWISAIRG